MSADLVLERRQKRSSMVRRALRQPPLASVLNIALTLLALIAFAVALSMTTWPDRGALGIAAWVVVALIAAIRFPIPASTQDSMTLLLLDTCVLLAGALLLEPAVVMVAVAIGALMGEFLRRRPGQRIVANTAQMVLQVGVASLVVQAAHWLDPDAARISVTGIGTLVVAGLGMHLVNSLAIAAIIRVDTGAPFLSIWAPMLHYFDAGQRLGHLGQWAIALSAVEKHATSFSMSVSSSRSPANYCERETWKRPGAHRSGAFDQCFDVA